MPDKYRISLSLLSVKVLLYIGIGESLRALLKGQSLGPPHLRLDGAMAGSSDGLKFLGLPQHMVPRHSVVTQFTICTPLHKIQLSTQPQCVHSKGGRMITYKNHDTLKLITKVNDGRTVLGVLPPKCVHTILTVKI